MSHLERLAEELEPLEAHLAEVEAELAELTLVAKRLRALLRPVKPSVPKKSSSKLPVTEESIVALRDWLRINVPNDQFWTAALEKSEIGIPKYHIGPALNVLHEQGLIRLDSVGKGGRRLYQVVWES